ncbi:MAG: tetratricopeptide repeat protein, partial [Candidatus Asgardarchaeia archaeon]
NIPKKTAIDNYGNLIVVGETSKRTEQTESRGYGWSTSIFLLKYSSTGDLIDREYWFDNQYTNIVIYDVTADNKTGYVYIVGKYTKKMDGSSQNMLFLIYYDGHELKTIGTIPINPYIIKTKIDANNRRLLLAYTTYITENEINIIQYDISSTFNSSIVNYLQNISYSDNYRIRDLDFSIDTYGNVYLASAASYGVTTYALISKISLNGSILWHTYKDIETASIYYLETMLVEKTFYVIVSSTEAIVIGYTSEGDIGTYTSVPTKFHMINDGYIYANGSDHILSVIEGASTSSAILELYSINNHTKVSSYEFYSRGILRDVDWMYWISGVSLYVSNGYIYVTLILSLQRYAKSDIRFCIYDNLIVVTMRLSIDSDGDGLSDYLESIIGTDPHDPDTDDDGYLDGYEYFELGTDPLTSDRAYIFDLTALMLLLAPIFLILSISLIARKTKQKTGKLQKAKKQQKKNELKQSIQQKTKDYSKIYNEFLKAHGKIDLNILDRVDAQHRKKFSLWIAEKLLNERKNELAKDFFIQAEEYNRAVSLIISLALYYRSKGEINKAKELYLEAAELLKKLNRHTEANEIVKKAKELS